MNHHTADTPTRLNTITQRVDTPFGACYAHTTFRDDGAIDELRISIPGTMHDKELGNVLENVIAAFNDVIRQ